MRICEGVRLDRERVRVDWSREREGGYESGVRVGEKGCESGEREDVGARGC